MSFPIPLSERRLAKRASRERREAVQRQIRSWFQELNEQFFDGFLDFPELRLNSRLRSSAGRFIPGSRKYLLQLPPVIEVADYLLDVENSDAHIRDTLAHEMIHYWLWVRHRPYGHTGEFLQKMRAMGVSRYNPIPKRRPYRHVYRCPGCSREFPVRRRIGKLACAPCCKQHSGGRYDARFRLVFDRSLGGAADLNSSN